jgi:SAM-dependent methyltransferase
MIKNRTPIVSLGIRITKTITGRGTIKGLDQLVPHFRGKHGLELGGPSAVFDDGSAVPVYRMAGSCDNCNFSDATVWQGDVQRGLTFRYHPRKQPGQQFICEASELGFIPDRSYDFVMAAHVIEHIANPLKAIIEWTRVLRTGGVILLVCPHKEATFDHRRPITSLSHLIEDSNQGTDEHDLTHLPEIMELHDLSRDPEAGSHDQFAARSQRNFYNRCLHHHVFLTESWIDILDYLGLQLVFLHAVRPFHIIAIGQKVQDDNQLPASVHVSNRRLLATDASWRRASPFRLDKPSHVPDNASDISR